MNTQHLLREFLVTGPGTACVETAKAPTPGPGELLLAPDVVGICATDYELFDGSMVYLRLGLSDFPLRLGHEWTALVTALGPDVEGFEIGDRVVGECSVGCGRCEICSSGAYHQCPNRTETGVMGRPGAMATQMVFPASSTFRVPATVSPEDAAMTEPLAVAYRVLAVSGFEPGMSVTVVGAGTIGTLAMMAAEARGASSVRFVETNPTRSERATSFGFKAADAESRADIVIESAGSQTAAADAIRLVAMGGTVGMLGLTGMPTVPIPVDEVVVGDIRLQGCLGSPGVWPDVIDLLAEGSLRPAALITHRFPLARAAEALQLVGDRVPGVGKVIVQPQEIP